MKKPVFSGINHIGIVTNNIDRAVQVWTDRYGISPWSFYTKDKSNMTAVMDDKPVDFAMRVALARISPSSRIEIIQPLDDRSPYAKSLTRHNGADHIHHIRFDVADYAETSDRLEHELGLSKIMNAEFEGAAGIDSTFSCIYFATEDEIGFITEIGHAPDDFAMPKPDLVYP
jgi:catechol 2,3-dioxygenase-like lactoylglutathione lyase family enzyme